ncbi:hypothetical protein QBC35DRAFT_288424 [Podospora australis]|uniref:Uncharacterized protein n=1 Tax=Podospora australis TaxID=1536484 RepID=A0AAN6WR51_9PEZI|nr:hypothetical protein QBC35DRAFT_288424 [Podospora australis]
MVNQLLMLWCFATPIVGALVADQYLGRLSIQVNLRVPINPTMLPTCLQSSVSKSPSSPIGTNTVVPVKALPPLLSLQILNRPLTPRPNNPHPRHPTSLDAYISTLRSQSLTWPNYSPFSRNH